MHHVLYIKLRIDNINAFLKQNMTLKNVIHHLSFNF